MCSHITDYYNKFGIKPYHLVNSFFSSSPSKDKRRMKAFSCYCNVCGLTNQSKLLSCLQCIYIGCQTHIGEHFKNKKHYVAVNLSHGKCAMESTNGIFFNFYFAFKDICFVSTASIMYTIRSSSKSTREISSRPPRASRKASRSSLGILRPKKFYVCNSIRGKRSPRIIDWDSGRIGASTSSSDS